MEIRPGIPTDYPVQVQYRIERIKKYLQNGKWLDYGCADGGYTSALLGAGAASVCGVDVLPDRVDAASKSHPSLSFYLSSNGRLHFANATFDGVFMNEVFEHVADEELVLREIHRVLKPRGLLILLSPNRCFFFEGHSVTILGRQYYKPAPLLPWLPKRVTDRWVSARNYWPRELRKKIESQSFTIIESGFALPTFEAFRWIPEAIARPYRQHITLFDQMPIIRRFLGVSSLVVARRLDR